MDAIGSQPKPECSSSAFAVSTPVTDNPSEEFFLPGPIRRRRFSSARIQPTRIKKVMQSDEEIGRMVASVPVAIGSVMELFSERLIQSAVGCLQNSTSKTLSPMHIKYAVYKNPQFSFLEPLLKDIPLPKLNSDANQSDGSLNLSNSSTLLPSNYYPTSNFIGKFPSLGRPSTGFSNDSKIKKSITVAVDAHGHPSILKRKRGRPPKIPRKSSEEKEDGGYPPNSNPAQSFLLKDVAVGNEVCTKGSQGNFNLLDRFQQVSCQKT